MSESAVGVVPKPMSGQKRKLSDTDSNRLSPPPSKRPSTEEARGLTTIGERLIPQVPVAETVSVSSLDNNVASAGSDERRLAVSNSQSYQTWRQPRSTQGTDPRADNHPPFASCLSWESDFEKTMPPGALPPGNREFRFSCLDWENNYERTALYAGHIGGTQHNSVGASCVGWEESFERTLLTGTEQVSRTSCLDWEGNYERVARPTSQEQGTQDNSTLGATDGAPQVPSSKPSNEEKAASAHNDEADAWDVSEAERLVAVLLANIEWRRALRALSSKLSDSQRTIKMLVDGRGGTGHLLARVKLIRDVKTPEAAAEMRAAKERLERCEMVVARERQDEQTARHELQHGSRRQKQRDARLYGFASDLAFSGGSVLHDMPPSFFATLRTCKEAAQHTRAKEDSLIEMREGLQAAEREVEILLVQAIYSKNHHSPPEDAGGPTKADVALSYSKKTSELSEFIKRQEALETQIEQAIREQSKIDDRLYAIAEQSLVARGLLPSQPGCAEASEGIASSDNTAQTSATGEEQLAFGTPNTASPERPSDAARKAARLATETNRRLKAALRAEFNLAHGELSRCDQALDVMHTEKAPGPEGDSTEAQEERGRAYFLEKSRRTRELMNAEEVFDSVLRRAQDAGLVGIEAKSEGFSSHASDGYLESEVRAYVSKLDHSAVEAWMKHAEEAGAPGSGDPKLARAGERTDDADLVPVIVETDADLEDIMPLEIGESFSVVACDKRRLQIDRIMDQRQQDGDGFRRRRRGSI